jgi:nucleoside-diphosphate-sugar epimerase
MGVIAVTGATGFVGRCLCREGRARGLTLRPLARSNPGRDPDLVIVPTIGPSTDWTQALTGVEAVIHCAAHVHRIKENEADRRAGCLSVNRDGTVRLAEQAVAAGVRRLIFLSSIKVNGESTKPGEPFLVSTPPRPEDVYGSSKWEAEQALTRLAQRTGLELVIVRPPLVYGPGVRANFLRLMQLVASGAPLPFASVENRRSLVALENLVDLLLRCLDHPGSPGNTFLVSDGRDLSTPQLIEALAVALGTHARLLPAPAWLLHLVGRMAARSAEMDRLIGSLQVDIRHTCHTLQWSPPLPIETGLAQTAFWFRNRQACQAGD